MHKTRRTNTPIAAIATIPRMAIIVSAAIPSALTRFATHLIWITVFNLCGFYFDMITSPSQSASDNSQMDHLESLSLIFSPSIFLNSSIARAEQTEPINYDDPNLASAPDYASDSELICSGYGVSIQNRENCSARKAFNTPELERALHALTIAPSLPPQARPVEPDSDHTVNPKTQSKSIK